MNSNDPLKNVDSLAPAMPLGVFLFLLLATAAGAAAAILVLPAWLPALGDSLDGSAPHAFWYLSRASALVAYLLLWLSMCLGLLITNKLARLWPGGPAAFDLHQHTSLLGLIFAIFHGLILLGDRYLNPTFGQIVIPFGMQAYRPFWVGLGQSGFFLMAVVALSFYVRKQITSRVWRLIHFASFAAYVFALLHGVFSGTDSASLGVQFMYWGTGGVFLYLLVYRLLATAIKPASARQAA